MGLSAETRRKLIREHGFYKHALEWQERAGFRCEFCSADLLGSVDAYTVWESEHIVPRKAGGLDTLENMALACRPCNQLKGTYDPRDEAGPEADRDALDAEARRYVQQRRARRHDELVELRALVQREMEL
ncbi:MAG: HNH endonuclease [Chloroflexi bacterium]|nr:HNH endonuclease [Chloroflexota bacterium]